MGGGEGDRDGVGTGASPRVRVRLHARLQGEPAAPTVGAPHRWGAGATGASAHAWPRRVRAPRRLSVASRATATHARVRALCPCTVAVVRFEPRPRRGPPRLAAAAPRQLRALRHPISRARLHSARARAHKHHRTPLCPQCYSARVRCTPPPQPQSRAASHPRAQPPLRHMASTWPEGVCPLAQPVELLLSKEDFKFNAAHFVVHEVRSGRRALPRRRRAAGVTTR